MHRLLLALVLGTASAGSVVAGIDTPVLVEGKSNATPDKTLDVDTQAQQAMDAATAAALIGALQSRFGGEDFELRLGSTRSERASLRDIALNGEAKIRFAGAEAWLPVRYEALYDTTRMVVESPHITLGAEHPGLASARDLPLARLQATLDAAMTADFQSNSVDVELQQARIVDDDGTRYVVQADGVAVFDGTDKVPMTARVLYDRKSGRWIDAQYDVNDAGYAVAAR